MIDAYILEALAATGCIGLGLAARRRSAKPRRPPPQLPRLTAQLPYRHRREAGSIAGIAREQLQRHPPGSHAAFTAREALQTYLPDTIGAYLAVPPALRRSRQPGQRSPDDELNAQFRTLRSGLERLREEDAAAGAARMAQNGAFLHDRFGPPDPAPLHVYALATFRELVDVVAAYLRKH